MMEPLVFNLFELEFDFLSNQRQLDLCIDLSSLECFLSSLPLFEYLFEGHLLFL